MALPTRSPRAQRFLLSTDAFVSLAVPFTSRVFAFLRDHWFLAGRFPFSDLRHLSVVLFPVGVFVPFYLRAGAFVAIDVRGATLHLALHHKPCVFYCGLSPFFDNARSFFWLVGVDDACDSIQRSLHRLTCTCGLCRG